MISQTTKKAFSLFIFWMEVIEPVNQIRRLLLLLYSSLSNVFFFFGEIQFLKKHQFHKVCWSDFPIVPIWAVWILFPNWLDYRSFAWSLLNKYAFIVYLHLQFTWQIFWSPYKFLCFCWCSRPYFNYRRLCCCCFCRFRLNRFVFHLALDRHSTLSLRSLIIARGAHLIAWHTY